MTKICVECRHHVREFVRDGELQRGHFCLYPALQRINRVTGAAVPIRCDVQRGLQYSCGPLGDFFQSRKESTK